MEIHLQDFCLVALIGTSGSGKSHFAARHFPAEQVVSQAQFAAITDDDGSDEALHAATLDLMHKAIEIRLQHRKSCIVDADLLSPADRAGLRRLGRKYHCRLSAIVLDTPVEECIVRNEARPHAPDRHRIRQQRHVLEQTMHALKEEGWRPVYPVSLADTEVEVHRHKAPSDLRHVHGPFDIIGDVHGCMIELRQLLDLLGYEVRNPDHDHPSFGVSHPKGRKLVFVGDLCDRGPDSPGVLRLVMDAVQSGAALCVPGNHDDKLMRKLNGNSVQLRHGLEATMAQLEGHPPAFLEEIRAFVDGMSSHLELDGGNLVVAHAGLKEGMHGRSSGEIHAFCLYGETTGETDEFGLPVRQNWAGDYQGKALVVYGHTPIPEPGWQNNSVNIDTGCVFGGELTALRYPERTTVAVHAHQIWCVPTRPMHWTTNKSTTLAADHSISMNWTSPRVLVTTAEGYHLNLEELEFLRLGHHLALRGVHGRWLIYAPQSISPPTVSQLPGYLEHPAQAIDYYRKKGVSAITARPMAHGTTVVVVLCRDAAVAERQFSLKNAGLGAIYTRSGRPYWDDPAQQKAVLEQMAQQLEDGNGWEFLQSDWLCLEAVIAPLAAKAPAFGREVHGVVHVAGQHAVQQAQLKLEAAQGRGLQVHDALQRLKIIQQELGAFAKAAHAATGDPVAAWTWHPQQLLATEGKVWLGQSQVLQQTALHFLSDCWGPSWVKPAWMQADIDSETSLRSLTAWWEELNASGQKGIYIGPTQLLHEKKEEMMQPWIKVRCKEYLRLLFGPHYDAPASLQVLRERNLRLKRETSVRTYALAKEGLQRFVDKKEFDLVYQCVFTLLGIESRPVDPRL